MKNCLIDTRNCCVSNYGVTIVYLYNDNKIIDINDSKLKCLLSCLCVIPFKLLSKFIKYYNYHIIYKMDNLYYTTNIKENHITPVIMNVTIADEIFITKKINLYINTNIDTPDNILVNNSLTLIKNNNQSPVPMEMSPDNNPMDCSPNNNDLILTTNECPDDKDITMVEISGKKEVVIGISENKDTLTNCSSENKMESLDTTHNITHDITHNITHDITTNFRVYNNSIPLWVFIKNENINLEKYKIIKIKYMLNNKIETIEVNILQNMNRPLYELFISVLV